MKTLTIRWEPAPGNPERTKYYVDETEVGDDDAGFDKIIELIRSDQDVEVILKIQGLHSALGGGSLRDSMPFGQRIEELTEALGANQLTYDFF